MPATGVGVEGVDDGCLPGVDFFVDSPVGEVEVEGYLAEGGQPGEFAGGFQAAECFGVEGLDFFDGWWEGEGVGV